MYVQCASCKKSLSAVIDNCYMQRDSVICNFFKPIIPIWLRLLSLSSKSSFTFIRIVYLSWVRLLFSSRITGFTLL